MRLGAIISLESLYFVTIAALVPVMEPDLPFATKVFDYFNLVFMAAFLCVFLVRKRLETCLLLPLAVIACGSLVAMLDAQVPATNVKTLVQEIYLVAFFTVLYNLLRSPVQTRRFVVCWLLAAGLESALILHDLRQSGGERALGTFVNPNMAGSYLSVSLFFVFYRFGRRHVLLRSLFAATCVAGIVATKSMSAALAACLGIGTVVILYFVRAPRRVRTRLALLGAAGAVLVVAAVPYLLTLENFLDRLPRSAGGRTVLWSAGLKTAMDNPLGMGIGPAGFEEVGFVTGGEAGAGERKSLHNDYLAFLVERGVVGLLGLLCLLGALARMLLQSFRATTDKDGLWTAGLCGMFVAFAADAVSHEMVHYRHVWVAIALIASQWRHVVRRPEPADFARAAASAREAELVHAEGTN